MSKFLGKSWISPCLPQEEQSLRHCHLTIEVLKHYSTKEIVEKENCFFCCWLWSPFAYGSWDGSQIWSFGVLSQSPRKSHSYAVSKLLWQSGVPKISIHSCFYAYLLSNTDTECQPRLPKSMHAVLLGKILFEEFGEHSRREGRE